VCHDPGHVTVLAIISGTYEKSFTEGMEELGPALRRVSQVGHGYFEGSGYGV
jgi:hypothetical protein